ncbi:MAG TPA: YetF domain-containing protein [Nevskiaceae bacterium]|nr:YetF domain-containing protein [Nevskiaceae bacterium]
MNHAIWSVDWHALFVPTGSLLEIFIRGSVIYLLLFFLMRFLRREAGQIGIADVLVIVVIADAAQNGMAGTYTSITEGVVLIATIMGWDYLLDWLDFHWPAFARLVHPAPVPLVVDGRVLWKNLRRQLITESELRSRMREEGIEHLESVKRCYMEGDGRISVIGHGGGAR